MGQRKSIALIGILTLLFAMGCSRRGFGKRNHVLTSSGQAEIVIMDFS